MASDDTITVKKVTLKEMTGSSGKSFTSATIESEDGRIFSGYDNQLPKDLKEGQQLNIKFQTINRKDGSQVNKVITTGSGDGGTTTKTTTTTSAPKTTYTKATKTTTTSTTGGNGGFNNVGARIGGVLHDAVAIAVHNASMMRTSVDLGTVEGLAQELLSIASRLEG